MLQYLETYLDRDFDWFEFTEGFFEKVKRGTAKHKKLFAGWKWYDHYVCFPDEFQVDLEENPELAGSKEWLRIYDAVYDECGYEPEALQHVSLT
jgi:hypothetical protein